MPIFQSQLTKKEHVLQNRILLVSVRVLYTHLFMFAIIL